MICSRRTAIAALVARLRFSFASANLALSRPNSAAWLREINMRTTTQEVGTTECQSRPVRRRRHSAEADTNVCKAMERQLYNFNIFIRLLLFMLDRSSSVRPLRFGLGAVEAQPAS